MLPGSALSLSVSRASNTLGAKSASGAEPARFGRSHCGTQSELVVGSQADAESLRSNNDFVDAAEAGVSSTSCGTDVALAMLQLVLLASKGTDLRWRWRCRCDLARCFSRSQDSTSSVPILFNSSSRDIS